MIVELVAIALGLAVGLSLGALGGGGSILAVPILVFVAGLPAQDATAASLLVVGIAAVIGVGGHYRSGNVRVGVGLAFGAAGIVGSRIGTTLNRSLNEDVLLLAFSVLIFFVAIRMFRTTIPRPPASDPLNDGLSSGGVPPGDTLVATNVVPKVDRSTRALTRLAIAATGIGLLTGLFGVGGGFAVVPALTLLLGFGTKEAIGTSLVVIAVNATIALVMRAGDLGFDWGLVVPFLATVTVGVLVGSRIARKVHADQLTRSFSIMLGCVAVYTAAGALVT